MELKDEQWALIEALIPVQRRSDGRGRPPRDPREVLDGILWILRTGARWQDLPARYPPYQTCHRIFQKWAKSGVFSTILEVLAEDLRQRGGLDLSECFIDGTFVPAKKGDSVLGKPSGAKGPRSWPLQTALVYLSPFTWQALHHTKSPLLKTLWRIDSWGKSLNE